MEKKKTTPKKKKLTKEEQEEIKQEGELPKKKIRQKETLQIIGVITVITIFFLAFLVPYFYVQQQKTFKYGNVTWQVEQHGEITLYHTQFGKFNRGQYYGPHDTFFRNDPRANEIPINIDQIYLQSKIIISQSPDMFQCNKQILVTDALNQITQALPFIEKTTLGTTDKDTANQTSLVYATCENKPADTTLIQVELGNQAKITEKTNQDCYIITIDKCENNLKAAERFIFEIIKQLNTN